MVATAGDDELRKLYKERYNAALEEVQLFSKLMERGQVSAESSRFEPLNRLEAAAADVLETPAEKIAFLKDVLVLRKAVERTVEAYMAGGRVTKEEFLQVKAARLGTQIELLKLERAQK